MFSKSVGHVLSFGVLFFAIASQAAGGLLDADAQDSLAGVFEGVLEISLGRGFALMNDFEHVLPGAQQFVSVCLCFRVGQGRQET